MPSSLHQYHQFIDAEIETDSLDVRTRFGGGVIIDAYNAGIHTPSSAGIELDREQVVELIGALAEVAELNVLDILHGIGVTVEVTT